MVDILVLMHMPANIHYVLPLNPPLSYLYIIEEVRGKDWLIMRKPLSGDLGKFMLWSLEKKLGPALRAPQEIP